MRRFLALSWDATDARAALQASRLTHRIQESAVWPSCLRLRGLHVFHNWPETGPMRTWPLMDVGTQSGGVILGQLFRQTGAVNKSRETLSVGESRSIGSSGGQYLVDRYWGAYAAFLVAESGARFVLRDPSAALTVYRWHLPGIEVFFSDLGDLTALPFPRPSIDWDLLAESLWRTVPHGGRTALQGVSEVLAAEAVEMRGSQVSSRMLWSPLLACMQADTLDVRSAVSRLRAVTERCIASWATVYDNITMHLSGGFDSAVVLGCLTSLRVRPQIHALNRFGSPGQEEDERPYARAAAARAGVRLSEVAWSHQDVQFERRLQALPIAPFPSVTAMLQLDVGARNELAGVTGAQATWSGEGGDHVFFSFRENVFVADHVLRHGLSARLPSLCVSASRLTRKPIAMHVGLAARARLGRDCGLAYHAPFVDPLTPAAPHAASPSHEVLHLWEQECAGCAPGKRYQLAAMVELLHRHVPGARHDQAPELHPLISLPLLELSLGLPTWLLVHGGRTRGLARIAFRDRLPLAIRRRDSKGSTSTFLATVLRHQGSFLSALLLDGVLAERRLIDRSKVEALFCRGQPVRQAQFHALLACIAAELWLQACARNWRQREY